MTTEKQIYQFEIDAKNDKLRSSQRHKDGWRPLSTSHVNNQWEIVWRNDPDPLPPPKRQLTQNQFIAELAEERHVRIFGISPVIKTPVGIPIKQRFKSWYNRTFK